MDEAQDSEWLLPTQWQDAKNNTFQKDIFV